MIWPTNQKPGAVWSGFWAWSWKRVKAAVKLLESRAGYDLLRRESPKCRVSLFWDWISSFSLDNREKRKGSGARCLWSVEVNYKTNEGNQNERRLWDWTKTSDFWCSVEDTVVASSEAESDTKFCWLDWPNAQGCTQAHQFWTSLRMEESH